TARRNFSIAVRGSPFNAADAPSLFNERRLSGLSRPATSRFKRRASSIRLAAKKEMVGGAPISSTSRAAVDLVTTLPAMEPSDCLSLLKSDFRKHHLTFGL